MFERWTVKRLDQIWAELHGEEVEGHIRACYAEIERLAKERDNTLEGVVDISNDAHKMRQENERLQISLEAVSKARDVNHAYGQRMEADLSAHALALKEAREVLKDLSFRMAIDVREGTIYHAEKISSQMCRIILDFLAQPASAFVERASKAAKIQEAAAVLLDAMRNDGEKTPGRPRTTPEQLESAYQRLGEAMGVFGQAASATRAEG